MRRGPVHQRDIGQGRNKAFRILGTDMLARTDGRRKRAAKDEGHGCEVRSFQFPLQSSNLERQRLGSLGALDQATRCRCRSRPLVLVRRGVEDQDSMLRQKAFDMLCGPCRAACPVGWTGSSRNQLEEQVHKRNGVSRDEEVGRGGRRRRNQEVPCGQTFYQTHHSTAERRHKVSMHTSGSNAGSSPQTRPQQSGVTQASKGRAVSDGQRGRHACRMVWRSHVLGADGRGGRSGCRRQRRRRRR